MMTAWSIKIENNFSNIDHLSSQCKFPWPVTVLSWPLVDKNVDN